MSLSEFCEHKTVEENTIMQKEIGVYESLGIDTGKTSVRKAFKAVVDNEFPYAFVTVVTDPWDATKVLTMHSDGDGSKFLQRLLHALVTGDFSVIGEAVDDGLGMNTGDVAASGFVQTLIISDNIAINGANVPKDKILMQVARRFSELKELYLRYGILLIFPGGETADLPDQTQSIIFDVSVFSRARRCDIISGEVRPDDRIFGFRSDGQAIWEKKPNTGLMSNGVTLARTCLMHRDYTGEFPFLVRPGGTYRGRFRVGDTASGIDGMTVSEAIMSPTRQWAIVIRQLLHNLAKKGLLSYVHGISMNTGGGAYKIGHVGKGIRYVKRMPEPPPLFQLVQQESGETWKKMFSAMNCGIGLDIVCADDPRVEAEIAAVSAETGVQYLELGRCESSGTDENEIVLTTPYGTF